MFDRWEKGMCYLNRHIEMSILSVGSNFSRRELEAPALVFVHHFMLILAVAGERYRICYLMMLLTLKFFEPHTDFELVLLCCTSLLLYPTTRMNPLCICF